MKSYQEIAGDGGSRVVEQVAAQRSRIERRLAGVRSILAVGSGKGGVGKSTLCAGIAAAVAAEGRRAAILDADMNGPTQARLAGLRDVPLVPTDAGLVAPRNPAGVQVVSLGSLVPEPEAVDFDSVTAGDSHVWRATREFTFLGQLLASVAWGELDLLLVDLPPGAERTVHYAEFLGPRTAFVLVTLPSALSRGVVARSVAALAGRPNRLLGTIENMNGYYCAGCGEIKPLFPSTGGPELGLPLLGSVPFDPELAERCDRGALASASPERGATRAVRELTRALLDLLEDRR